MSSPSPLPTRQTTVRLYRTQAEFRRSPALYRGFVGGRGSGKSWVGAYDLLRRAKRGHTYLVASPTGVKLQDETYPTFQAIAKQLGAWNPGGVRLSPYPTVTLGTGAVIRFRTAEDPEKLRGPNLSGVWLDEASLMEEPAYLITIACLREHGEQGWLSATFTPKGLTHWTKAVFDSNRPDTALFRAHTKDNPFNPPEFADTLARQYGPQLARQELAGEFLAIEGAEWPAEYFDHAAFWFDDWPTDLTIRTIALDPSKGRESKVGDYAAFALYGRDANGWEYAEGLLLRADQSVLVDTGLDLIQRFKPDGFAIEGNAFQHLFGPLFQQRATQRQMHFHAHFLDNTVNKLVRIRRLTEPLQSKRIRFRRTPGTRLLVDQLRDFPLAEYDDAPDALEMSRRLAIELHNKRQ